MAKSKLRGNKETQKLAPLHEGVQLIKLEANLNSKIQILGRVATIGKRYFGLYKDMCVTYFIFFDCTSLERLAKSGLSTTHLSKKSVTGFGGVTSGIRARRMVGETLKEMMSRLEEVVRDWSSEDGTVSTWAAYVYNELDV